MTDPTTALTPTSGASLSFGQSNLSGDNLIPPRVKIVQQMSEERSGGLAEAGDFFNTLTSEDLGPTIKFLPLLPFMNRILLVRDQKRDTVTAALRDAALLPAKGTLSEGDGLKCRSLDMIHGNGEPGIDCAACPLSRWDGQVPPLCTEVYNIAAVTDLGELVIVQFQKSSAKTGKKLFSMLRFAGDNVAPWARFYEATTHEETIKGKGSFFVPVVRKLPEVPPTELMGQAQRWAAILGAQGPINVTPEDDDEPGGEPDGDAPF